MKNSSVFLNQTAKLLVTIILSMNLSSIAEAKIKSSCYKLNKTGATVEGVNEDELIELASVSKVFTTYYAINQLGLFHRFETRINVTPVSGETRYDLHLEGGFDPSFEASTLYYVLAQLRDKGITEFRNITFDDKFIFYNEARLQKIYSKKRKTTYTDSSTAVKGDWTNVEDFRGTEQRITQLKTALDADVIKTEVPETRKAAASRKLKMTNFTEVAFETIDANKEFAASSNTITYVHKSGPLSEIVRDMNKFSNNYFANALFYTSGGKKLFHELMAKNLEIDSKDIAFVNGSGGPWYKVTIDEKEKRHVTKVYNKATCTAVLTVLEGLEKLLKAQDPRYKLNHILSVHGVDAPDEMRSNFDRGYKDEETLDKAVAAKTGYVTPMTTLAGEGSAQDGEFYFAYMYANTESGAYKYIENQLIGLLNKFGGRKDMKAPTPLAFVAFDEYSALKQAPSTPALAVVTP